jgi:ketosteroid isomerase-like protein
MTRSRLFNKMVAKQLLAMCALAGITWSVACSATPSTGRAISQPGIVPASADTAALVTLDSIWARNYARNDTVTADKLMAPDFFMTSGNGRVKTKAEEMGDIRPSPGLRMLYFRTEGVHVHVYGEAAVVSGFASWSFEQNGRTPTTRRRYTAVYTRGGPLGWMLRELHIAGAT